MSFDTGKGPGNGCIVKQSSGNVMLPFTDIALGVIVPTLSVFLLSQVITNVTKEFQQCI